MDFPRPRFRMTVKGSIIFSIAAALLLANLLHGENEPVDPGRMLGTDYDLEEAFDPSELRRLANDARGTSGYNRRLWQLILRAGLEKDASFMELVREEEIRKSCRSVELAVSAYEYMIHGTDASLDFILAQLATEPIGADTDTPMILSVLNEWDRTIKAYAKHFHVADGAAATNAHLFHAVRKYLYPDEYARHRDTFRNPWQKNPKAE